MTAVFTTLVVLVCFLVLLNTRRMWSFKDPRRNPKLPPKGKGTMFHVRHLLMEAERDLAMQLYCEIFSATSSKAKKDVEELERSLKV